MWSSLFGFRHLPPSVDVHRAAFSIVHAFTILLASLLFLGPFADDDGDSDDTSSICARVSVCLLSILCSAFDSRHTNSFVRDSVSARVCTNSIWLCDRFEIRSINYARLERSSFSSQASSRLRLIVCVPAFHCMRVEERSVSKCDWKTHMDYINTHRCKQILHGEYENDRDAFERVALRYLFTPLSNCVYAHLSIDRRSLQKHMGIWWTDEWMIHAIVMAVAIRCVCMSQTKHPAIKKTERTSTVCFNIDLHH